MARPRHLSRAPITEAVIDLRVSLPPEFDVKVFASLGGEIGNGYGPPQNINLFTWEVRPTPGKDPESKSIDLGCTGYRYDTQDGKCIVQFRKDGFTFSRLSPYTTWEQVFSEAARLYRIFFQLSQPFEATRIAVRYINRLLLPEAEIGDFSAFLTAPPPFPKEARAIMTGFLTQVEVQEPGTNISARVTQAVQPGGFEPASVPVILDLDVFEPGSISPVPDVILPRFEALRGIKNRYFFASLTEKTLAFYE